MMRSRGFLNGRFRQAPDRGSVMIVILLVLFLLTSLGISYVALTQGDRRPAATPSTGAEAVSSAQAGIAEALQRMSVPGSDLYVGEGGAVYHPGWGRYLVAGAGDSGLDPQYEATTHDALDNDADGQVDEVSEHYSETSSKAVGVLPSAHRDTPWVKIRYKLDGHKRIVYFGDHDDDPSTPPVENLSRGVPELIVTAAGRSGSGWKLVTVEAVKWPLPPTPAALYVEGGLALHDAGLRIDGRDHDELAPQDTISGLPAVPAIAAPTDAASIAATLTPDQAANVRGAGGESSVLPSLTNLDLKTMATEWSRIADVTLEGDQLDPATASWGTPKDPAIIHVAGNLRLTGAASGNGVLLVDGDLDVTGPLRWCGLVLCLRDAHLQGTGAGISVVGTMLVQGSVAGRSDVGGNVSIVYSGSVMRRIAELTGYEVSSWIDQ
ncbi:MAG: hypothetical protein ACRENN_02510 [Candidatus Eiseniibacteriota bacterium]